MIWTFIHITSLLRLPVSANGAISCPVTGHGIKQYVHVFLFADHYSIKTGCNCMGSCDARICICASYPQQWQDNSICRNWPKWLLSALSIHWKCSQQYAMCASECPRTHQFFSHAEKYVVPSLFISIVINHLYLLQQRKYMWRQASFDNSVNSCFICLCHSSCNH